MNNTHTDVRCGTCGWESPQPEELTVQAGMQHVRDNPRHVVQAVTTHSRTLGPDRG